MLGLRYRRRSDLFEALPRTRGGRIELLLSADTLRDEVFPSFETFLPLSYRLPSDVLECRSVSGSASTDVAS